MTQSNTTFSLAPDLEDVESEEPLQPERAVSTPMARMVSQDQFDVLCGRVNDLLDKFYREQEKSSATRENVVTMGQKVEQLDSLERKLEHLEGNLLPDLKTRIKTVKKSIPSDVSLPVKNKEGLEQVKAQLERARAKIAVLENQRPEQKIKISDASISSIFGKFINLQF